jgi:copper chaperone
MQTKTFEVPNISCKHCVMTIKNELGDLNGVQAVQADQESRMVTVQYDAPASWDQIKNLLVEINYPPAEGN